MPPGTRLRTFIEAIQTGTTRTTRALDVFFTDPGRHQNHPHRNDFKTPGAFNMLPQWARTGLRAALSDLELAHIDSWPDEQKEAVRDAVDKAINDKRRAVHFFWLPSTLAAETTEIIDPDGAGDITIKFFSPRQMIRVVGNDEVTVDVGTPG
jgi:hypothetical protein